MAFNGQRAGSEVTYFYDITNNGDPINTATSGTLTLTVTAADNAANSTTETVTIDVTAKPVQETVASRELTGSYAEMTGIDGSVARLYMAVFNRQPDAAGLVPLGTQTLA